MKYILKPHIKPVGYLGRPYAMYDEKKHETSLLDREQFRILLKCSGESELDNDTLSKREAAFLQRLLRLHYIEPAQDGARRAVFRDYRFFANPIIAAWSGRSQARAIPNVGTASFLPAMAATETFQRINASKYVVSSENAVFGESR